MPDDYEQSVGKLQSHISDDQICDILCSGNSRIANNKILNCLIEKLKCREDLLDLCDQLEKIAISHDLMVIIKDIKTGLCLFVCTCMLQCGRTDSLNTGQYNNLFVHYCDVYICMLNHTHCCFKFLMAALQLKHSLTFTHSFTDGQVD